MAVTLKGQTAVYEGTSTDTKPIDADNNAIFKELDTGISYYYDGTDWNEIPSSGGGGGGTGTDNYNELKNKPSINGTVLSGNKSLDNLDIQKKLTFDSAPTEDSENPVESGGVYSALAGKQDTISDLPTIRSGAAAGATAVQPAALSDYQPVISDLDTIRAGAAAGATAVQPADMTSALTAKQDALSSVQLEAVNSGITSADVEQITSNKNNILLSLIMPFATNNYNVSNLSVKANATIDTSTGIITQTTTDTQANLRFQISAFNGTTLVRYLTENIIMTNNGVYYFTFAKSSDYNTLAFGHNGSAADFKVALPVSALSNGDYIFKINILNCIQGNGAYSFSDIAILKKTGAYII